MTESVERAFIEEYIAEACDAAATLTGAKRDLMIRLCIERAYLVGQGQGILMATHGTGPFPGEERGNDANNDQDR